MTEFIFDKERKKEGIKNVGGSVDEGNEFFFFFLDFF